MLRGDTSGIRDSVVNQLLAKLDGVDALDNVLVVGLTNRPELNGRRGVVVHASRGFVGGRLSGNLARGLGADELHLVVVAHRQVDHVQIKNPTVVDFKR